MQSLLITGGNLKKRREQALAKVSDYQIANLDTLSIEEGNSIGIKKVRELEKWVSRKPYSSKFKAAIILQAEKLTHAAQNALLKTLEEPPINTLIILTAPKEAFLLPTITSRCKIFGLKTKSEISLSKHEITQLLDYLISLLNSGVGERVKKAEKVAKTREETIIFFDQLTLLLREFLLAKSSQSSTLSQSCRVSLFSDKLNSKQIVEILRRALKTKVMIEKNVNTKLCLENFFLDLPYLKC